MLALPPTSPSNQQRKVTPNILPCAIKHNGPIKVTKRYWSPTTTNGVSEQHTTYLRGRKLLGRKIRVPEGYQGLVLSKTDRLLDVAQKPVSIGRQVPCDPDDDDEELEGEEKPAEVKLMELKGNFDEIMVWDHDAVVEDGDEYVKGLGEWIGFAEAVSVLYPVATPGIVRPRSRSEGGLADERRVDALNNPGLGSTAVGRDGGEARITTAVTQTGRHQATTITPAKKQITRA